MEKPELETSCPVPTVAEARIVEILDAAQADMIARIRGAIEEATRVVSAQWPEAAGNGHAAPQMDYYAAVAQQFLFCEICDADPKTLEGGRAEVAAEIIRNCQGLAASWEAATDKDAATGS